MYKRQPLVLGDFHQFRVCRAARLLAASGGFSCRARGDLSGHNNPGRHPRRHGDLPPIGSPAGMPSEAARVSEQRRQVLVSEREDGVAGVGDDRATRLMIQGQLLDAVGLLAGDASALVIVGVLLDDPALSRAPGAGRLRARPPALGCRSAPLSPLSGRRDPLLRPRTALSRRDPVRQLAADSVRDLDRRGDPLRG